MSEIRFEAKLFTLGRLTLLRLPENASLALPSRGMVMVEGTIDDAPFQAALEPDGMGGHWLKFDEKLMETSGAKPGDTVALIIKPSTEWPDPEVPKDLASALAGDPQADATWVDITPKARWDWVRWINGTKKAETRKRRIEVARSKLRAGSRRPCCFNRNQCSDMEVSMNGVLLETTQVHI